MHQFEITYSDNLLVLGNIFKMRDHLSAMSHLDSRSLFCSRVPPGFDLPPLPPGEHLTEQHVRRWERLGEQRGRPAESSLWRYDVASERCQNCTGTIPTTNEERKENEKLAESTHKIDHLSKTPKKIME